MSGECLKNDESTYIDVLVRTLEIDNNWLEQAGQRKRNVKASNFVC